MRPGTDRVKQADATRFDQSQLVEALRRGDDAAYEQVVNEYAGRLLAVARRMLRNEDEAQDAVQEAFLSAFRSIDRFKEESRLSTWLHRILVNAALMRIRARKRRPTRSMEELLPKFDERGHVRHAAGSWSAPPDRGSLDEETRAAVYDAMAELPEDYRNVLLLRDIEELSTREAAEVLATTEGAVKIRLHRARQALRELLDSHFRGATA